MSCEHKNFEANTTVGRIESESGTVVAYNAVIQIHCRGCGLRFQFLGLPLGLNGMSTGVSLDGLTAGLEICPEGERQIPFASALKKAS
jgi:hypothetical protein